MKTAYIIRLKLPLVKVVDQVADLEKMKCYLYVFMNLTLPSILQQTNQDFICFIQHQAEVTDLIQDQLTTRPPLPANIKFTTNMRQEVSDYLISLSQQDYDQVYLIKLNYNLLCAHDFIDYLHFYMLTPPTRVLAFSKLTAYNLNRHSIAPPADDKSNAYVYICSMREYIQHLRLYDYYYPALLDQKYLLFPIEQTIHPCFIYLTYNGAPTDEAPSLNLSLNPTLLAPFVLSNVEGGLL